MKVGAGTRLWLFSYGFLVHFLGIRLFYRLWAYNPDQDASFVDHPLTNLVLPFLGGFFFAVILIGVANRVRWQSAGLLVGVPTTAVVSTLLSLEIFYLLASAYSTVLLRPGDLSGSLWVFLLWFISIQTYGIVPLILGIPYAAAYGLLAWLLLLRLGYPEGV